MRNLTVTNLQMPPDSGVHRYHTANAKAIKLNNFGKGTFAGVNEFIQSKFTYAGSTIGYIGYFNYSDDEVW